MFKNTSIFKNRYEIVRRLASRPGQQTFLARDWETQDLVVLKLLTFGGELEWKTFRLFEREAKTLKELKHFRIPCYVDYFDVETKFGKGFALVQSYINAPSLEEHIKAGRTFSETQLKQIASSVLEILIYLHNRHPPIIHRDIKPSNILLTNCSENGVGQIYLIDFGSVEAAVNREETRTIVGTYGYMAPEQFAGRAKRASDLYGLGATIIYLASGHHPADLPHKDFRIDFKNYVSLSPAFVDWLQWVTEPSLELRFLSANDAKEALENKRLQKNPILVSLKPIDSKVVLTRTINFLKINIPPKPFRLCLLNKIVLLLISSIFLIQILESIHTIHWLFHLVILVAQCGLISRIMFILFGYTCIFISKKKITFSYQMFGIKYNMCHLISQYPITKIERTELLFSSLKAAQWQEIQPEIRLWLGTKIISVGGTGLLSEIELDWLVFELSNWLNLPITRTRVKCKN